MTFQPSTHYQISTPIKLKSKEREGQVQESHNNSHEIPFKTSIPDEWLSSHSSQPTYSAAYFLRLGDSYRTFNIDAMHELHCLSTIQKGFLHPEEESEIAQEHVEHCFNYLTEMMLCEADDTLEPKHFKEQVEKGEKVIFDRVCRDWGAVFEFAASNLVEFRHYRDHERAT